MSTISFDTHTFVKHLTQAGMPLAQAEVLADSQARLIDDKLATKHDLNELGSLLSRDNQWPVASDQSLLATAHGPLTTALRNWKSSCPTTSTNWPCGSRSVWVPCWPSPSASWPRW